MAYYCRNHPQVETESTCPDCRYAYCDACTVEFLGRRLCGPCRDARLMGLQYPHGIRWRRIVDPRAERPFRVLMFLLLALAAVIAVWALVGTVVTLG